MLLLTHASSLDCFEYHDVRAIGNLNVCFTSVSHKHTRQYCLVWLHFTFQSLNPGMRELQAYLIVCVLIDEVRVYLMVHVLMGADISWKCEVLPALFHTREQNWSAKGLLQSGAAGWLRCQT